MFKSAASELTDYFFLAVAGFLVTGFAAGFAAPVLALVDFAAAGLAAERALVDDLAAVLFATIPRFLRGEMLWHQN